MQIVDNHFTHYIAQNKSFNKNKWLKTTCFFIGKEDKRMKKLLTYILLLGLITGIIPIIFLVLISKHSILAIIAGITAIVLLAKELCF